MILVTGGTGLVGSHLLFHLRSSGKQVRAIYRTESSLQKVRHVFSYYVSEAEADSLLSSINWSRAELTDIPSLEQAFLNVDQVYHCAAVVSFDTSKDALLRKANIQGTANIVNLCISNQINKLCYVSSIATFDLKPGSDQITESSFWNKELNHSMYAITKYGAEMEVWRASQEGVPVVIINPGVIIGPGFWNSSSGRIFQKIDSGLSYFIPKTTGFIGVWDVVKIMEELMGSDISNQQYILVSENLSFKQVFSETAEHLGKPAPHKPLKKWMVTWGWFWQEISGFFSNKEKQLDSRSSKSLFMHTFYNSDKLEADLNYSFEPISEVIAKTASYYKKDKVRIEH